MSNEEDNPIYEPYFREGKHVGYIFKNPRPVDDKALLEAYLRCNKGQLEMKDRITRLEELLREAREVLGCFKTGWSEINEAPFDNEAIIDMCDKIDRELK